MRRRRLPDETLDDFREGVAELELDGALVGHLATIVEPFLGLPGGRQERVWLLVTWSDGRRERIEEDYPPWTVVEDIRAGTLEWTIDGHQVAMRVSWLRDEAAADAWRSYGIHEDIGHYL